MSDKTSPKVPNITETSPQVPVATETNSQVLVTNETNPQVPVTTETPEGLVTEFEDLGRAPVVVDNSGVVGSITVVGDEDGNLVRADLLPDGTLPEGVQIPAASAAFNSRHTEPDVDPVAARRQLEKDIAAGRVDVGGAPIVNLDNDEPLG